MTDRTAAQWMVEPLRKYASFGGRARRAEYWWFQLFCFGISIPLTLADTMIFGTDGGFGYGIGPLAGLFALAVFLPGLAVSFRRLHDLGRSAWWLLILLIPFIGMIVLLVWFVQRGTIGSNRFGADPLVIEG